MKVTAHATGRTVFVVAPRTSDPDWLRKQAIIRDMSAAIGVHAIIPEYASPISSAAHAGFDALARADLVLADLSYERPSSYYELGAAEALGRRIALIAKRGTPIHQTTHAKKVIEYNTLEEYRDALRMLMLQLSAGN